MCVYPGNVSLFSGIREARLNNVNLILVTIIIIVIILTLAVADQRNHLQLINLQVCGSGTVCDYDVLQTLPPECSW